MMTHIALANKHKVIAFEPLKKNFKVLCATINRNNWNDNLELFNYALGAKEGVVSFKLSKDNQGGTAVFETSQSGEENSDYAVEKTLDSFGITGKDILLKIDVEGFECKLFEKVEDFFSKNTIHFIWMEWGQIMSR